MADKKKVEAPVKGVEPAEYAGIPAGKPKNEGEVMPTKEVVIGAENAGKTIDERMADLLADHKAMGAR